MRHPLPTKFQGQVPMSAGIRLALAVLAGLLGATPAEAAPEPAKVGGPESCAECHLDEIQAWKQTAHFRTFNDLHRRPEATAILEKLGLAKMKGERRCMDCHYLNRPEEGALQSTNGISCESCHGAGRDWAKTHGDYGEGFTKATESAEHRNRRRAEAILAGMITPANLHALGATCYLCHVIADEQLVNTGGHPPSSEGFNLLTWSQGEVRHTMLRTDYQANPEATPAHRRRLYVVGLILEVEYGFRAVAQATARAPFGLTLARRTDAARKQLEKIQALAPTPELAAILPVAQATGLRLNNAAALNAAAEQLAALGRKFADQVSGEQLAGIDSLVPDASHYRGKPPLLGGAQ
jgi:DNA-binding phage protein